MKARKLKTKSVLETLPEAAIVSDRSAIFERTPAQYLVCITHGDKSHTESWNSARAHPLNHPPTLFLEKDEIEGIRVVRREIQGKIEIEEQLAALSEPLVPGRSGAETEIDTIQGRDLKLKIARILRPQAARFPLLTGAENPYLSGEKIYVSCGIRDFLSAFENVAQGSVFSAQADRFRIFKLRRTAKGSYLSAHVPGVLYKLKGKPAAPLSQTAQLILNDEELKGLIIHFADYWWRFSRSSEPVLTRVSEDAGFQEEFSRFGKILKAISITAVLGIGLGLFLQKHATAPIPVAEEKAIRVELKKPKRFGFQPTQKQKAILKKLAEEVAENRPKFEPPPVGEPAQSDPADLTKSLGSIAANLSRSVASIPTPKGNVSFTPVSVMRGKAKIQPDVLNQLLLKQTERFQACYNSLLTDNPNAAGSMTISWTMTSQGIADEKIVSTNLTDRKIQDCVRAELGKLRFQMSGNEAVTAKYQFVFAVPAL